MMWGADRMDRTDSKSVQPGETPGHLAIFRKVHICLTAKRDITEKMLSCLFSWIR